MKLFSPIMRRMLRHTLFSVLLMGTTVIGGSAPLTLYSTQFETAEGFVVTNDLAGQNGWIKWGDGGNGLTDWNADLGYGQSAYIGFERQNLNVDGLFLWRPINHVPTNRPLVTVAFDMSITDSFTTTNRDQFRWSVYNTNGVRLFSLIFEARDFLDFEGAGIYKLLDDDQPLFTGWQILPDDIYSVEIQMNYASNRWNAWVGGVQVITNELITTTNAALTFGDADAVWLPGYATGAGDNFMVFDDLTITADVVAAPAAILDPPLPVGGGQFLIRVNGSEGAKYAVEASTQLSSWVSLKTNVVTGGYFDYLDTSSAGLPQRFYRARFVP